MNELDGVAQTLLIPLLVRARESKRADALLRDNRAVELNERFPGIFTTVERVRMDENDRTTLVLRNREFDRLCREFLARHPGGATVVHIGCGLDSRFERVDDGAVRWYDLDLPDVIALRRRLIGGESERYRLLPHSAFDGRWPGIVAAASPGPFLFLAEGVFMYFAEAEVRSLALELARRFPGSTLAFDGMSPLVVRANNRRVGRAGLGARYLWACADGRALESWGPLRLTSTWRIFDRPEPRLKKIRWLRFLPLASRAIGIYTFRLGE